jgi:hypothetical protein
MKLGTRATELKQSLKDHLKNAKRVKKEIAMNQIREALSLSSSTTRFSY